MPGTFRVSLVTPERSVVETEASYAELPAHDGQLGVQHNRAAMLIKLGVGKLRLDLAEGGVQRFVLDGGFAQMRDNKLTLLCERAYGGADIGREEAQQRLTQAQSLPMGSRDEVEKRRHDLAVAQALVDVAGG